LNKGNNYDFTCFKAKTGYSDFQFGVYHISLARITIYNTFIIISFEITSLFRSNNNVLNVV
jgi:hypothetical protein